MRLLDISMPIDDAYSMHTPTGVKDVQFKIEVIKDYDAPGGAGQVVRAVQARLHTGTHIDAPAHFDKQGKLLSDFPLTTFVGPAWVANLKHRVPGSGITAEDLEQAVGSKWKTGDRLLLSSGWNRHYGKPHYDEQSPYLTLGALDWIVSHRPSLIGHDFSHSKDAPDAPTKYHAVRTLLQAGIPCMDYLVNLDEIDQDQVLLIALPWAVKGTEAAPTRAVVVLGWQGDVKFEG